MSEQQAQATEATEATPEAPPSPAPKKRGLADRHARAAEILRQQNNTQEPKAEVPTEDSEKETEAVPPEKQKPAEPAPPSALAIKRAEQRLAKEREELDEARKKWQEQQSASEAELAEIRELAQLAESDKFALVAKLGLKVDDWARWELENKDKVPQQSSGESEELRMLREKVDALEKERNDRALSAEQQDVEHKKKLVLDDIGEIIKNAAERFPYVSAVGNASDVYDTIMEFHRLTGKVLNYDEALQHVENYFVRQAEAFAKVGGASIKSPQGGEQIAPQAQTPTTTETKTPAPADRVAPVDDSHEDRIARAARILRGA